MIMKIAFILAILFEGSFLRTDKVLFPEIEGWKLSRDKEVYTPGDLWELIDGAAELYLAYDFQDLHMATYSGGQDREVRVELYRHSTPANTYGIYTAERMPDYHFIEMGVEGYTGPGILHFFTGHYYVKVLSVGSGEVGEEILMSIAGRVSSGLGQPGSWPEEVGLFPEDGKIAMSDAYYASDFIGYSFLHSAFTARYNHDGEFTLFIIHGKTGEAKSMMEKYLGLMKGEKVEQKGDIMVVHDLFNGTVYLNLRGDYLVGAMNAAKEEVAVDYIGKTIRRIKEGIQ
jgi:hypothetical protein